MSDPAERIRRVRDEMLRQTAKLPEADHNGRAIRTEPPAPSAAPALTVEQFQRIGKLMEAGQSFEDALVTAQAPDYAGSADAGARGDVVEAPEPKRDSFAAVTGQLRDLLARQPHT